MFDVLGIIFEVVADVVSDLFEDGADAIEGQGLVPAAIPDSSIGTEAVLLDPGGSSVGSALAATDGGIAADRFDPQPPRGPFTP